MYFLFENDQTVWCYAANLYIYSFNVYPPSVEGTKMGYNNIKQS